MSDRFPEGFLWGAATAGHQVEGGNISSNWWHLETQFPGLERSGDACDSYHRYEEDFRLLADQGFNAYRFSVEWSRIQPELGWFSRAERDHYGRMMDGVRDMGMQPVVTLNHFTMPQWFHAEGGWEGPRALDHWQRFLEEVSPAVADVEHLITFNEPNMLAVMAAAAKRAAVGEHRGLPAPDEATGERLVQAHHAAIEILRASTNCALGWTVACQAFTPVEGHEDAYEAHKRRWEDIYLEAGRGDDFIGVQAYGSQPVGPDGPVPADPNLPDNTLTGIAFRPDSLAIALRNAWDVGGHVPLLVTENGIATSDDALRIRYIDGALSGLLDVLNDGITVRGYLHWSLLDNYEWGHWAPTFGLVAVDRTTFVRTAKPSLAHLGAIARRGRLS